MKTSSLQTRSMTDGPVLQVLLRFFLPIMLGTILQQLYSTVDAVILGRYVGTLALAAVGGSSISLINLVVSFFVGFASGSAVIISQHFGADEPSLVSKGVHTAMLLAAAIGLFLSAAGIIFAPMFLLALETPQEIMEYSMQYLRWYFVGMMPSMVYNMGSGIMRAVGDTKRPLWFLIVCTVVNTVLDILFVVILRMEVRGAAIATSLSQLTCALLVIRTLSRADNACRLSFRLLRFDPWLLKRMLMMGLPAGLHNVLYSLANLFVQKAINRLGTESIAAWSVFWKIDGFFWPAGGAIGLAVMTFVGQNYGARKKARIFEGIRKGMLLYFSVCLLYGVLVFLTRSVSIPIFTQDEAVIDACRQILSCFMFSYALIAPSEIYSNAMRGAGNALKPTILTLLSISVLRIVLLYTVAVPHLSNLRIAFLFPSTWAASSLVFFLYYKFGKWMPDYPDKPI